MAKSSDSPSSGEPNAEARAAWQFLILCTSSDTLSEDSLLATCWDCSSPAHLASLPRSAPSISPLSPRPPSECELCHDHDSWRTHD